MPQPVLSAEPIPSIDLSRFSQVMDRRPLTNNDYLQARAALAFSFVLIASAARAWDDRAPAQEPVVRPTLLVPVVDTAAFQAEVNSATQPTSPAPSAAFDSGTISAGQAAFSRSCTACHDEQRSL